MKIEWICADLNEAVVTRGLLWWQRQAVVALITVPRPSGFTEDVWQYANSRTECEAWLAVELHRARNREAAQRRFNEDWQPVTRARRLPAAVVRR